MIKRIWVFVLAVALLLGGAAFGETVPSVVPAVVETPPMAPRPQGVQGGTELTIGTTSVPSGYFFSDMWGYNTSDMDVRMLLGGYRTVAWTRDQGAILDGTVVEEATIEYDGMRNKTYLFTLRRGLTYNDGTPITAADYVFSILLNTMPQVKELGGATTGFAQLTGYENYASGQSAAFSGVRLLSDTSFSMQIAANFLEYYYELAYVDVQPAPISVIAPGCQVADDGGGAYLRGNLTADQLRETLLNPQTGYVFAPRVTSGAYQLENYDPLTHEATFVVNRAYLGNHEGQRPHIERVRLVPVTNANMEAKITSGEVGLLHKVGNLESITTLLERARQGEIQFMNYPRSGFAFLSFACEQGPTASQNVRQAIAYAFDKDAMAREFAGDYGMRVYACYGMGQWMTTFTSPEGAVDVAAGIATLPTYAVDVAKAQSLLEEDGWIYNAAGEPFAPGDGQIRYKQENGALVPLAIRWAQSQENAGAQIVERLVQPAFAQLGIGLEIATMPFDQMLDQYYRKTDRTYHMFYLASNFTNVFDPYFTYNTAAEYQGAHNTSGLRDAQLERLARSLRETPPGNDAEYCAKWLTFQQAWAEALPAVPLFSNVYFDVYRPGLVDYRIGSHASWATAVLYAYFAE